MVVMDSAPWHDAQSLEQKTAATGLPLFGLLYRKLGCEADWTCEIVFNAPRQSAGVGISSRICYKWLGTGRASESP